jgi:hypothetical protein
VTVLANISRLVRWATRQPSCLTITDRLYGSRVTTTDAPLTRRCGTRKDARPHTARLLPATMKRKGDAHSWIDALSSKPPDNVRRASTSILEIATSCFLVPKPGEIDGVPETERAAAAPCSRSKPHGRARSESTPSRDLISCTWGPEEPRQNTRFMRCRPLSPPSRRNSQLLLPVGRVDQRHIHIGT